MTIAHKIYIGLGVLSLIAALSVTTSAWAQELSELDQEIAEHRAACLAMDLSRCRTLAEANRRRHEGPGPSIEALRAACNANEYEACQKVARRYAQGTGVETDLDQAVSLLQRACENNHYDACRLLAHHYTRGAGVPRDSERARSLNRLSCEHDVAEACASVASEYLARQDQPEEQAEGLRMLVSACESESASACSGLAFLFGTGHMGIERNLDLAAEYAQRGCDLGSGDSCSSLSQAHFRNGNIEEGRRVLEHGCDIGSLGACSYLAFSLNQPTAD